MDGWVDYRWMDRWVYEQIDGCMHDRWIIIDGYVDYRQMDYGWVDGCVDG